MAKKLVIVGYKLLAEVAHSYFEEFSDYQVVAFACHQEFKKEDEIYGLPLSSIESLPKLYPPEEVEVFVAIGYTKMNKIRGYKPVKLLRPFMTFHITILPGYELIRNLWLKNRCSGVFSNQVFSRDLLNL